MDAGINKQAGGSLWLPKNSSNRSRPRPIKRIRSASAGARLRSQVAGRQGFGYASRRERRHAGRPYPDRLDRAGSRAGHRRPAPRPYRRDLRTGILGQNDAGAALRRRGPEGWAARAAFIDAEHALDPMYAKALGVDIDSLLVIPAGHGRAGAGDLRRRWCARAQSTVVVIDSVAAHQCPRAEIEGEMGDSPMSACRPA